MSMRALVVLALASCWSATKPSDPPVTQPAAPVEIAIASVRLADDCGSEVADAKVEQSIAGDCAGNCNFGPRACEQTQLQISVRSSATETTAVSIKRIEILDADGKVVG